MSEVRKKENGDLRINGGNDAIFQLETDSSLVLVSRAALLIATNIVA